MKSRKKILLVEDEAILALTEKIALEKYGYEVIIANSGEKAVQITHDTSGINLILMDIDLGEGMDGTEAAAIILKDCDIPVVFYSSHTEPEIVEKTEKITSYGYVVKNSSITVLDASIKMAFKLFEARDLENKKHELLQESEEKYRLLHETSGAGIGYYNLDGTVISFNNVASKYMNRTPEDLIGKSIYDIFPEQEAALYHNRIKNAALSSEPVVYNDEISLPSGKMYFISTFTKIIDCHNNISGIQIISQDITEQKKAEEALRTSETCFRMLFQNMNNAVAVYNAIEDGSDFVFLNFNRAAETLEKISKEDLIGKKVTEIFPGIIKMGLLDVFKRVWKTGVSEYYPMVQYKDNRIKGWRNNFVYKLPSGEIVSIYDDVTEQKIAEEKLKDNFSLLRIAGEKAKLGGWSIILEEDKVIWSDEVAAIHEMPAGYSPSLQDGFNFYPPEWHGKITELFTNCAKNGISYDEELEILTSSKKRVWVRAIGEAVRNNQGEIFKVQGAFQDITERRSAEEKIKIKSEELEAANAELTAAMEEMEAANEEIIASNQELLEKEKALIESEEKFRLLYMNMDQGMAYYEAVTDNNENPVEYKFLDINDSYTRLFNVTREKAVGKRIREVIPDLEKYWAGIFSKVAETGNPIYDEIYFEDTGKYYSTHSYCPKKNHFAVLVNDSSERRQIEYNLQERMKELQAFYQLSKIVERKDLTLAILYQELVNFLPKSWKYSEIACARIIMDDQEFRSGNFQETEWRQTAPVRVNGELAGKLEVGYLELKPEKDEGPFLREERLLIDSIAERVGKITERKIAENKIKTLLEGKETLLKEVHHRIKNNILSIENMLSIQLESVGNLEARSALQNAVSRVSSMRILYDKLMITEDYSELSVKCYLESLIEIIIVLFQDQSNISIIKNIDDFNLPFKSIFTLGSIVNELITNAEKHAFKNRESGQIGVTLSKMKNQITLTIQDNGVGIPESFDADKPDGFGLMLVSMLSKQLDGTFLIENHKGTRSTLKFKI
ncbi:MAG: PAS domain S-box protein [Spirochaetes bacterium]|nr:PAS domain S-box protein [Spirochaetota bacterium]